MRVVVARVASLISASRLRIGTTSTGAGAVRLNSASTRLASLMSLIRRSSRITSSVMIGSSRAAGRVLQPRSVSIALRID